jgi:hypothetical protein
VVDALADVAVERPAYPAVVVVGVAVLVRR